MGHFLKKIADGNTVLPSKKPADSKSEDDEADGKIHF